MLGLVQRGPMLEGGRLELGLGRRSRSLLLIIVSFALLYSQTSMNSPRRNLAVDNMPNPQHEETHTLISLLTRFCIRMYRRP